jgi:hypothetical protein
LLVIRLFITVPLRVRFNQITPDQVTRTEIVSVSGGLPALPSRRERQVEWNEAAGSSCLMTKRKPWPEPAKAF